MTTEKKDEAKQRKERPLARGCFDYFPDALLEVAHVSFVGNEQHNPGEPMHWDKGKSPDHADCLLRHLGDRGTTDTDGLFHTAKVAWRALALLQVEIEEGRRKAQFGEAHLGVTSTPSKASVDGVHYTSSFGDLVDNSDPHKPVAFPGFPRKVKTYLAGPMRGIKDFNFPAFDAARDRLLKLGVEVISPADMDRQLGHGTNRDYAKRDTKAILECDAIYMLKGWEKSVGAIAEHALAKWIGITIFYQEEKC